MAEKEVTLASLDGRTFVMVSSTASTVDPAGPTVFEYHQQDAMVWGEYRGDTVRAGRFLGTRSANAISIGFVHVVESSGEVVTGRADSVIEDAGAGKLRLVENFANGGGAQVSICAEL